MLQKAPVFRGFCFLPGFDHALLKRRFHELVGGLVGGRFLTAAKHAEPTRGVTFLPDI